MKAITLQLIVSLEAKQDLIEIYQYTAQKWGQIKADNYLQHIKKMFADLQRHPHVGVERPELFDSIRFVIVGSHNMYYRFKQNQIEIVRVLHGRQDPKKQF